MSRVVRAFLAWVMVFAMPVQGMAASAMSFCGPVHGRMLQGLIADAPGVYAGRAAAPGHGHSATGQGVHAHPAHGGHAAGEPAMGSGADGTAGPFPHHGEFSCSACAACCAALALPASFVLPEPSSPAHLVRTSPAEPVASHPPDGPDRPPRAVLA